MEDVSTQFAVKVDQDYGKKFLRMRAAFWTFWACHVIILVAAFGASDGSDAVKTLGGVAIVVALIAYVGSFWYYIYQIVGLANGAGRSRITWGGLTFIFGQLGILISYFKMKAIARTNGWMN